MSLTMVLAVAGGGALGAVARYLVMAQIGHWFGHGFPWSTLVVNVVGSFALGALVEILALVWSPAEPVRALLVVGLLGAFTTFSTFSLDVVLLIERGQALQATGYITASVVLCVAGLFAGMRAFRWILT